MCGSYLLLLLFFVITKLSFKYTGYTPVIFYVKDRDLNLDTICLLNKMNNFQSMHCLKLFNLLGHSRKNSLLHKIILRISLPHYNTVK